MKLLLDEMWPSEVALQLRRRGHDVVAVAERPDLRGQPDPVIFATAQAEERVVVAEKAIQPAMKSGRYLSRRFFRLSSERPFDTSPSFRVP